MPPLPLIVLPWIVAELAPVTSIPLPMLPVMVLFAIVAFPPLRTWTPIPLLRECISCDGSRCATVD